MCDLHPARVQALVVYECLSEWGQILCAICPNLKLVITGGTSTAICVWETGTSKERAKALTLKQVPVGFIRSRPRAEYRPPALTLPPARRRCWATRTP